MVAAVLSSAVTVGDQSDGKFCDGSLGEVWTCDTFTPIPSSAIEEFYTLPGTPDPANPVVYKQIAGEPAFDESGERNDNAAVFVLDEELYFCMLVDSGGEAVLFDAPEGKVQ